MSMSSADAPYVFLSYASTNRERALVLADVLQRSRAPFEEGN